MDLMQEILQSVESKSRDLSSVFSLKPGEKKKVRFLCEGPVGLTFDFHGRFIKGNARAGWSVPCPVSFKKYADIKGITVQTYNKKNCPYCIFKTDKETSTVTEQRFAWLIWNYTDGCIQAFVYKVSDNTPARKLAEQYVAKKTIMDRDFIVEKQNIEAYPATTLDKDDPSLFNPTQEMINKGCVVPKNDAQAQRKILDLMAKAWCPELLSPNPEFVLPEQHQPQTETVAPVSIEDMFADTDMLPSSEDAELEDLADL